MTVEKSPASLCPTRPLLHHPVGLSSAIRGRRRDMNVMMLLEMARDAFGDRVAFTDASTGASLTYEALFEASRRRAGTLAASGARRVAALDTTSLASPLCLFAGGWAGVPYVPLNYRLTDPEIAALMQR